MRERWWRIVGDRQQRLQRELEKLALEHGAGARLGVAEVEASSATSAERKIWTLADALVAGDAASATRALLELRQQGERVPGLLYGMVRRLRDALGIAEALAAGQPAAQVKKGLRMPSFAAERLIADVAKRDVEAFRRALELMADLELESRGGGGGVLSEDTAAVRAVIGRRELKGRVRPRGRGASARRGTSCARRCCDAAPRA